MKCGNCSNDHATVDDVRNCYSKGFLEVGVANPPASEKQINFAQALLHDRVAIGQPAHLETTQGIQAAEEFLNAWDKRSMSDWISAMKEQPRRNNKAPSGPKIRVDEGFYHHGKDVFKVQRSLDSNHLYAKKIDPETGDTTFIPGMVSKLDPDNKMSLEEAKQYGKLYGRCIMCGRRLTNEESIQDGIGPICSGKWS